ncbi:uncharacterized protein HGUI_00353 [Hanseniaspora guilliermondii]|uniref:DNA-binding protein RAP1 n=1 Tax=Hanseniaspora guilliermondii TaxID=56406 RepID=A0A1L0CIK1_9ASCO|nr:uncharacterized protein HGUI_00353 [Hanseniaspora guilliermondii]
MQAVQGLLSRLFSKGGEKSEKKRPNNNLLSPTESKKNIELANKISKETPEGINDGPIMNDITNSSDESDSSMEILEVRSFTTDDELRILKNNYMSLSSHSLMRNINNDPSRSIEDDMNSRDNDRNVDSRSIQIQPYSLDINRESQHEKESQIVNETSLDFDKDNVIVEFKNETQAMDQKESNTRGTTFEDDVDFIDQIEKSLINKHILEPVDEKNKIREEPAFFEQMIPRDKEVTFEEENLTSEEEFIEVIDSNDNKKNVTHALEAKGNESTTKNDSPKNILEMIEEAISTDIDDEEGDNQLNTEMNVKDNLEALKAVRYSIGSNKQVIEEPSEFAIQKVKTPYLDKDEINLLVGEEKKGTDHGSNVIEEKPTETLKRKAEDQESQNNTENVFSNPLLNGFFSQKKNKLKKRKVYIASEIKTLNSSLFTKEEDDLILEYVRSNPHLKNSHSLYDHIAKRLTNHTGNSIRRRFFNKLEKEMGYHYEIDEETGDVAKDEDGNAIKNQDKINTSKSKYTAEEDYSTALLLKCHFFLNLNPDVEGFIDRYDIESLDRMERAYYEMNLIPVGDNKFNDEKIILTNPDIPCSNNGKVIDWKPDFAQFRCNGTCGPVKKIILERLVMKYPNHSIKSWRDRCHRFLKPYGIDRYIYYYNKCRVLKIEPEPITGVSSAYNRAILMHRSKKFPENVTLADLEMRFTRRRV